MVWIRFISIDIGNTRSNPDLGTGTCENTFLYKQKNKMPSVLYFIFSTISAIDPSPPPPTPHPIHKGRFSPSMKGLPTASATRPASSSPSPTVGQVYIKHVLSAPLDMMSPRTVKQREPSHVRHDPARQDVFTHAYYPKHYQQ